MADTLRQAIEVVLKTNGAEGVEQLRAEFARLGDQSGDTARAVGATIDELDRLGDVAGKLEGFARTSEDLARTQEQLDQARRGFAALNDEFSETDRSSKQVAAAFRAAEKSIADLSKLENEQTAALSALDRELKKAGIDTDRLADEQARLGAEAAKSRGDLTAQASILRANAAAAEASAKRWKDFGDALKRVRAESVEIQQRLLKVGAAAAAAGAAVAVYGAGKFFSGAIESAADLEVAFDRVQVASKLTADELKTYRSQIEQIGLDTQRGTAEAAEAFELLAREGSSATESLQQLPQVLNFATAASLSAKDAVAALSGVLDAFGLAASKTGAAAEILATGAQEGGTNIGDLTAALAKAGPIAGQLNVSLSTTVAALAELARAGIEGGRAGTALATILGDLQDPASKLSDVLSGLGIKSRDLGTVLDELKKRGNGAEAAFLSLGDRSGTALRVLASSGGAALKELAGQLDDTNGAVARMAAGLNESLAGAAKRVDQAFEALRTSLVDPLLEPLQAELDGLATSLREFAASQEFDQIKVALVQLFGDGTKAAREFLSQVDFGQLATQIASFASNSGDSLREFGENAKEVFEGIESAFDGLQAAFNAIQTGVFALAAGVAKAAQLGAEFAAFQVRVLSLIPSINLAAKAVGVDLAQASRDASVEAERMGDVYDEFASRAVTNANETRAAIDDLAGSERQAAADAATIGPALARSFEPQLPLIDELTRKLQGASAATLGVATSFGVLQADAKGVPDVTAQINDLEAAAEKLLSSSATADFYRGIGASADEARKRIADAAKEALSSFQQMRSAGGAGSEAFESVAASADAAKGAAQALNNVIQAARGEFAAISNAAAEAFDSIFNGAARTITSVDGLFDAVREAQSVVRTGLDEQKQSLELAIRGYQALAAESDEAFLQMRGNAGRTADELSAMAEATREGRNQYRLLNQADLSRLASEIDRLAERTRRMEDAAAGAREELERLNQELQDAADRRSGNEAAIAEREHQAQLRRIEELAAKGGAAAQAAAAQARALADAEHRARLAEIAERERTEAAAAQRSAATERGARTDQSARDTGATTAQAGGFGALSIERMEFTFNGVDVSTPAGAEQVARAIFGKLQHLTRLRT